MLRAYRYHFLAEHLDKQKPSSAKHLGWRKYQSDEFYLENDGGVVRSATPPSLRSIHIKN